jgi:uncharacterized membrane protein YfcA
MDTLPLWLPVTFFAIAVIYSMAGLGGGCGYLAVLALIGVSHQSIPQTVLICNLIVSATGVWHFSRGGHFDKGKVLPFVALSIPMAYLGGRIAVGEQFFMILSGISLAIAGSRMFLAGVATARRSITRGQAWRLGLPIGAVLGLLAGIVGIGGGVFLGPVLVLTGWMNAKQAAATAALFVFVNSAAGLTGQFAKGIYVNEMVIPLALAALIGGQLGARAGSYHMPTVVVRRVLAALVVVVSFKLVWGAI